MKIFLATSFEDKDGFRRYQKVLIEKGYDVPDWTSHKPIRPYPANLELTEKYNIENINDVLTSDYFFMDADHRSKSSFVEFGMALNSLIHTGAPEIYVTGGDLSMYFYHPLVKKVESFDQFLTEMEKSNVTT